MEEMIAAVGTTIAGRGATATKDQEAIGTSHRRCRATTDLEVIDLRPVISRAAAIAPRRIDPAATVRQLIDLRPAIGRAAEQTAFPVTGQSPVLPVREVTALLVAEGVITGVRRRPASVADPAAWEGLTVVDPEAEDPEAEVGGGKKY